MSNDPTENHDLSPILADWPFEPGTINVRVIRGFDHLPKIQVRLDLGVIQMNIDGRPDGLRPHGFASLLEYFETRIDEAQEFGPATEADAENGETAFGEEAEPFSLDADAEAGPSADPVPINLSDEDCRSLREEAAQYYHRYVALLVLEDFEGVIRDTTRNLRVADLCRDYGAEDRDREMLEQVRPYILMMRARAIAGQALKDDVPKAAIAAVDDGLAALREHYENSEQPEEFEQSSEAASLRQMRDALVPKLPVSQKTELRERLHEAIKRENYELAAILRNELRMLGD
jgi:hypothetical protein